MIPTIPEALCLLTLGASYQNLADAWGCDRSVAYRRIQRSKPKPRGKGRPARPIPTALTIKALAEEYGTSPPTMRKWLRALLDVKKKHLDDAGNA